MTEIFKSIGYKNYSVSNLGNVKNEKTGRIIKQFISSGGYKQVQLGINSETGKQYVPLVHKLVADAFIPNPNNLPIINHKDENKLNNSVSNLEWVDYIQNINYGTANQKKSKSLKGNQNAKGKRKHIGKRNTYIYFYNGKKYTIRELLKELDCSKSKITEAFRRNLGLVKNGSLTRKVKEEIEALDIGYKTGVMLPRELTEEEINALDNIFKGE